jgi:hypothetical protein
MPINQRLRAHIRGVLPDSGFADCSNHWQKKPSRPLWSLLNFLCYMGPGGFDKDPVFEES